MKKYIIGCFAVVLIGMIGCKKEQSFELGNKPSAGSLQSEATGDCLPKSVNGVYIAAEALVPATNTLTVSIDVTKTGVYTIYTDTINGYFFRGTGTFVKTGVTAVTLRSNGTPFAPGINNFVVTYEGSSCDIAVEVLATAPLPPAVFTLTGSPTCTGAVIGGAYATGNALNFTNTVTISVNVTTIGTYDVTTVAKNGMTFAKKGSFTATGAQTIVLEGSGTPTVNGPNDIPISVGSTTCSFTVPVGTPSAGTLGITAGACTPATPSGTYTLNTPLVVGNTVEILVNVTTPGVFSISTDTKAGISFAASGTFPANGPTAVTLNGKGTPTAAGPQTFTVTYGANTCTFTLNIAGPPGVAVFTPNCATATVAGTYQAGVALTAANTITIPITVSTAGTYNITTATTNGMIFKGTGTLTLASTSIVLVGTGSTPLAAATPSNIPIPGSTTCNVPVTVTAAAGAAVFSANCATATVAGTYQAGTPLTAANTVTLPITVTTAGSYNITTTTTNGMIFKASGTLTLASTSIVLVGTGSTPTAAASPSNIPMPGTASCTVPVTVIAGATIQWKFNIGATVYQGQNLTADNDFDVTTAPPRTFFSFFGDNAAQDQFSFDLADFTGGINTNEQYNTASLPTTNFGTFYFLDDANTIDLTADPTEPTVSIIYKITSHNTTTKTIIGTFSGTAKDAISNTTKTITAGTFTAVYQ